MEMFFDGDLVETAFNDILLDYLKKKRHVQDWLKWLQTKCFSKQRKLHLNR